MNKTIFSIFAAVLFAGAAFAQTEDTTPKKSESDTSSFMVGQTKVLVISPEEGFEVNLDSIADEEDNHHHWAGVDIGINGWMPPGNSLDLPAGSEFLDIDYGRSIYWSLNFMEHDFEMIKNRARIVTGLGVDFNGYSFKNDITLDPVNSDALSALPADSSGINYGRNKLKVVSLTVPLMIGINTNDERSKSFRMAVGVVGKYAMGVRAKQVYTLDGVEYRPIVKDDFHVNRLAASAIVRMGYGPVNLFASYTLTPFFDEAKAPELRAWTAGVTVLMF